MSRKKPKEHTHKTEVTSWKWYLLSVGLCAGHAVVVFWFPAQVQDSADFGFLTRQWGFNFLTAFSTKTIFLWYVFFLIFSLPPVLHWLRRTVNLFRHSSGLLQRFMPWILLSTSGVIFWIFRFAYPLLGDTTLRLQQITAGEFYRADYGVMLVNYIIWRGVNALFDVNVQHTVALFSVLSGVVYAGISYSIVKRTAMTQFLKGTSFGLLITAGFVQSYFGYIEMLPITGTLLLLFFSTAIRLGESLYGVILCTLLYLLMVFMHFGGAPALPVVCVLWYWYLSNKLPLFRRPAVMIVTAVVSVIIGLAVVISQFAGLFLRLNPVNQYTYTLFSLQHGWETINGLILAGPLLIPLCLLCAVTLYRTNRKLSFPMVITGIGSLSFIAAVFSANLVHGSGDWDAYAITGVPLALCCIYGMQELATSQNKRKNLEYIFYITLLVQIWNLVPGVAIHASDRSIDRVVRNLYSDPADYYVDHPPFMHLSIVLENAGLDDKAYIMYQKATEFYPDDPRVYYNNGLKLTQQGQFAEAIPYLEKAIELREDYPQANFLLAECYQELQKYQKAEHYYLKALQYEPGNLHFQEFYIRFLFNQNQFAEGKQRLSVVIQEHEEFGAFWELLGSAYLKANQLDSAETAINRALEINPENYFALNNSGVLYSMIGDRERALSAFKKASWFNPEPYFPLLNLAKIYWIINEVDSAQYYFDRTMSISNDRIGTYQNILNFFEIKQLPQHTPPYLDALEKISPETAAFWRQKLQVQ